MRSIVLLAVALSAGSAQAAAMRRVAPPAAAAPAAAKPVEEPGYLFDALRLPRYKMAWVKLMKDVQPTPDWLHHFSELDGMAGEMKALTVDGKPARLSFVCKPEDCAGHKFEVLFAEGGARAVGALGGKGEPPAFFGAPSPAEQEALSKGLSPVAAADAPQPKSE